MGRPPGSKTKSLALYFTGREDCLGNYILEGKPPAAGEKFKGRAISYPNSHHPNRVLTKNDYVLHVEGKIALGIVPVFQDGTCRWFSIDVDDYSLDHLDLAKKIDRLQLPIVHCRSKSGGAHLYGLISEPIDAKDAIEISKKWIASLGLSDKCEIFPKQTRFDSPEAKGNWIIIPYFGGEKALDFAIDSDGKKISYKDFLQYCESKVITPSEALAYLKKESKKAWSQDEILEQSPPCIRRMMDERLREGDGRNNAASHLSWYYRKLDEFFETDDWRDKLAGFNSTYFDPPMDYKELNQIIKNHSGAKSYKQRCTQTPMTRFCDREACLKLKFGIKPEGNEYSNFEFTQIIKIDLGDDPLWKSFINGQPVTTDTNTLLNPKLFRAVVLKRLNILIPLFKQAAWDAYIIPLIGEALVIEHVDIVNNYGKVDSCFKQWITQVIEKSRSIDKLLDGLPFYDSKNKLIYFRHNDFVLEYNRVYKERADDRELFMVLKAMGFETRRVGVRGGGVDSMMYSLNDQEPWFNIAEEGQW